MDFFHQFVASFTATHFVGLCVSATGVYIAKTMGKRFGRSVVHLNDNLERLNSTILKVDILWEKQADVAMFRDLEMRERHHATKAAGA